MKLKKNLILSLTLLLAMCVSCADELSNVKDYQVSSHLKFNGSAEMFSYVNALSEDDANPNGKTASTTFESFDVIYKKALTELSDTKTIRAHDSLLQVYEDVVTLSDGTYVPKIKNALYQSICNRQGIYESEGYVHKVFDDQYIVSVRKEHENQLYSLTSLNTLDEAIFNVVQYQDFELSSDAGKTSANCGLNIKAVYFDNSSKCSDDRRAYVRAYAYFVVSGDKYTPAVISESWGEIRNWLCNWKEYATVLRTRNCSFDVSLSINGVNVTIPFQFDDFNGSRDQYSHTIWNGPLYNSPIIWKGGAVPVIYFSRIHEEATTRGVGYDHFAVIDCK